MKMVEISKEDMLDDKIEEALTFSTMVQAILEICSGITEAELHAIKKGIEDLLKNGKDKEGTGEKSQ
jgi:hypothetical protein